MVLMMVMKRRIPTRMQAAVSNVNEDAMRGPIAQKIINCPFDCQLAVLVSVNGDHGGAGVPGH